MASSLLACCLTLALSMAYTSAAALPIEEVVDQLQTFLTAPLESGLRMKRSSDTAWDKELDLSSIGVVLQLKYNNPSNLLEGGHAHVKFPGRRFVRNAPFDDVELDIEFNGGSAIDGLFDMKVDYKFVQKFTYLADKPRSGGFLMFRKLEEGQWKSKVVIQDDSVQVKPFFELSLETDRKTLLHALFNYAEEINIELSANRVPGQSIHFEFVLNGKKHTAEAAVDMAAKQLSLKWGCEQGSHNLDLVLNPAGNWGLKVTGDVHGPIDAKLTMQPDFKQGEVVVKYKGQNYAFMTLTGQAELAGVVPQLFDYVVKYNINDAEKHTGKAKVKYDGRAANKQLQVSFAPQEGSGWDYVVEADLSNGFKYLSDLKVDGAEVERAEAEFVWTNDDSKFELKSTEKMLQTKDNPFFEFNKKYLQVGREMFNSEKTRTFFFDKVEKNKLFNKMTFEEKTTFDGKTLYDVKYDSTTHKVTAFFTYLPMDDIEMFTCSSSIEYLANNGVKFDHEFKHGESSIHECETVFDVKTNDANKFEMDMSEKMTVTEESPFYSLVKCYTGRYGRSIESKAHVFVDKKNKSVAFIPKMELTSLLMVDGKKVREFELDNTRARRSLKLFWVPDMFTQSYNWVQTWEIQSETFSLNMDYKRGAASVFNYDVMLGWLNNAAKLELNWAEKVTMTEESTFYSWGKFMHGRYWKKAVRTVKVIYNKQDRNILFGKMLLNDIISLDDQKYRQVRLDTQETPYDLVWYQPTSGSLLPSARHVFGQDELKVTAKHIPGQELEVETNLEKLKSLRITTEGITRKFELNGEELLSVDFDASAQKASNTMKLPSGEEMTMRLAWPKVTTEASDLEFGVTISPDRKLEGKLGWELSLGRAKGYLDLAGSNPWLGDYKVSRSCEMKMVSRIPMYNLKMTGHDEATKGPLAAFSPMETDVKVSINANTMKVDVDMSKTFGGKKWGLILENDKFELISGRS